jgi:prephenate dehydrogenase (NADP+)
MGTAWHNSNSFPWETTRYVSGIEVVKVNITLRIYAAKWHVYAGLALLNPSAKEQVEQYAQSVTALFKLMVEGREADLAERVWRAREGVFGWKRDEDGGEGRAPILLSEDVLDQFSLRGSGAGTGTGAGGEEKERAGPNSHLSLLAMVDCWNALGIRPFEHLDVAGTPVFMLWIGERVGGSVFKTPKPPKSWVSRASAHLRDRASEVTSAKR